MSSVTFLFVLGMICSISGFSHQRYPGVITMSADKSPNPCASEAYDQLCQKVIMNSQVLKSVGKLCSDTQTSGLEGFHSTVNQFAPKMFHSGYQAIKSRVELAALHFNENGTKGQRKSEGQQSFNIRYPKSRGGQYIVVPVMNTPTYIAPLRFQGRMHYVLYIEHSTTRIHVNQSYDAIGKRIRQYITQKDPTGRTEITDRLWLFKTGVLYNHNVLEGTCSKGSVPISFPTMNIPANATYKGKIYLGKAFPLDIWRYKAFGGPNVSATWTGDGSCWPVSVTNFSERGMELLSFFNQTLGIHDPSVWEIPKECHQAAWQRPDNFWKTIRGGWWQ